MLSITIVLSNVMKIYGRSYYRIFVPSKTVNAK